MTEQTIKAQHDQYQKEWFEWNLLMKKHARNLSMHLVPKEAQFLLAYIQTSQGDIHQDWFVLHIWKLWDCWDRKR